MRSVQDEHGISDMWIRSVQEEHGRETPSHTDAAENGLAAKSLAKSTLESPMAPQVRMRDKP